MRTSNDRPPVDRLATGLRMATVIVVMGTLAAVFHPAGPAPAAATGDDAAASAPASAASAGSDYFPSRFPAPMNVEPQAPTF